MNKIKKGQIVRTAACMEIVFNCVCGNKIQTIMWGDDVSAGTAETECSKCDQEYYFDAKELSK